MSARDQISIGFMPLLDAAILVIAREKGFAAANGLALDLIKETSWANIRDRISVGHFDAAHMLAPMPIAANLGLNPLNAKMIAPMALGFGGNAITVSLPLWRLMAEAGAPETLSPAATGKALRDVIHNTPDRRLRFGVVHPFSGHNYELRYWLAACGITPDTDVEFAIVPPPLMPDALSSGAIDGFCVGEPWNTVTTATNAGHIVTVKEMIWRASPEKVLGLRADWAERNPEILGALIRSLYEAARWCGRPENHEETAEVLGRPDYLDQPPEPILRGLSGHMHLGGGVDVDVPDFFSPFAHWATFPWISHALWLYSQMVRWQQVPHSAQNAGIAAASFQPDLYRKALAPLGAALPGADTKIEGETESEQPQNASDGQPGGFFDGKIFDPHQLETYIAGQKNSQTHKI